MSICRQARGYRGQGAYLTCTVLYTDSQQQAPKSGGQAGRHLDQMNREAPTPETGPFPHHPVRLLYCTVLVITSSPGYLRGWHFRSISVVDQRGRPALSTGAALGNGLISPEMRKTFQAVSTWTLRIQGHGAPLSGRNIAWGLALAGIGAAHGYPHIHMHSGSCWWLIIIDIFVIKKKKKRTPQKLGDTPCFKNSNLSSETCQPVQSQRFMSAPENVTVTHRRGKPMSQ